MTKLEKYKENIQSFANQHKVIFDDEGTCGFGRKCVGLTSGDHWIDYNPYNRVTYEEIPEFFDERLIEITPKDAYHKHDCIAVLGRGEEAIKQLSEWVDSLRMLGAEIVNYETGASGIHALLTGHILKTIKLPK